MREEEREKMVKEYKRLEERALEKHDSNLASYYRECRRDFER